MARIQKQVAIALPPELRAQLEKAAEAAGHSVSEEIRRRLAGSFVTDETHLRRLLDDVARLAKAVKHETGQDWTSHPGSARALQAAIDARLARCYGTADPATFQLGVHVVDYADVGRAVEEKDDALSNQLIEREKSLAAEITRFQGMLSTASTDQKEAIEQAVKSLEQQIEIIRRLRGK